MSGLPNQAVSAPDPRLPPKLSTGSVDHLPQPFTIKHLALSVQAMLQYMRPSGLKGH